MSTSTKVDPKKRRVAAVVSLLLSLFVVFGHRAGWLGGSRSSTTSTSSSTSTPRGSGSEAILSAFRDHRSDVWIECAGVVVKLLPDDQEGAAHQKMLVRIDDASDLTVLLAHNIDAAKRVPAKEGDHLRFRGEYEWTEKGGTVHFTHAPEQQRRDPGGWIEHDGVRYE